MIPLVRGTGAVDVAVAVNKANNVFKDGIGVKGLRFNLHVNNHGTHGKHYGNLYGNYHDTYHRNHGLWTLVENIGNFCLLYLQLMITMFTVMITMITLITVMITRP